MSKSKIPDECIAKNTLRDWAEEYADNRSTISVLTLRETKDIKNFWADLRQVETKAYQAGFTRALSEVIKLIQEKFILDNAVQARLIEKIRELGEG